MNDSEFDAVETADNLLARWDSARGRARSQAAADAEFRVWLMRTMPELAEAMGPDPGNARAHCITVAATIERCVSLGRRADACTLSEWLADAYVPRGDDLSLQTILGSAAFCSDVGQAPELNERATRLLTRVVEAAPGNGGAELERAICKASVDLSTLYTVGRTATDIRRRTRASIDVCDDIIARWGTSRDDWLRSAVAGTMLNKAMCLLEFGDEPAARQQYALVVESFAADGEGGEIGRSLSIARHALQTLDTVRFPEPEFKVEYFEARRRRARRWLRFGVVADARRHIRAAHRLHDATADFVRHATCVGQPWVLLLRNFDLMETSIVTGERDEYAKAIYFTAGLSLVNQLIDLTDVVQVANTKAAALEIDKPTMSVHGRRKPPNLLYLPDSGWLDNVRVLIDLAERIVVWAHEKTPALLQELALITELGRAEDTLVLLEKHQGADIALAGFGSTPRQGADLTPGDPVLAGFGMVMLAREARRMGADLTGDRPAREEIGSITVVGDLERGHAVAGFMDIIRAEESRRVVPEDNPFLRETTSAISTVQQLPMAERVARIRRRIDQDI